MSARYRLDAHRKVLGLSRWMGSWCAFMAPLLLNPSSRRYNPLNNNDKPAQEDEES